MKKKFVIYSIFLLIVSSLVFAGTTGKISGRVVDKATGEPLPFANIVIVGTNYGTVSDVDGYYYIINLPPGVYAVQAKMMGYATFTASGVKISSDLTTQVNFPMSSRVIELEGVIIKEKVIKKDITSTRRTITADVIKGLPVDNFSQAIETGSNTVGEGKGIHIRGGRFGEVLYMVDGLSIKDPLFTGGFGMLVGNNAVQEMSIIFGGFSAEYGQAKSGVVNLVTKEGNPHKLGGNLLYRTDRLPEFSEMNTANLNYDRMEVSLGGPDYMTSGIFRALGLKMPGQARFFLSTDGEWSDGYAKYVRNPLPRYKRFGISFQDRKINNYTGNAKWTYEIGNKKLSLSLRGSKSNTFGTSGRIRQDFFLEYIHNFKYAPEFAPRVIEKGEQEVLTWNHMLTKNTFYTVNLSRFVSIYNEKPGGLDPYDINDYSAETSDNPLDEVVGVDGDDEPFIDEERYNGVFDDGETYIDLNGNGRYDKGEPFIDKPSKNGHYDPGEIFRDYNKNGIWDGTEPYTDLNNNKRYDIGEPFSDYNQNGRRDDPVEDGFLDYGFDPYSAWRDFKTITNTLKFDITTQRGKAHLLKTGIEFKRFFVRKGEILYTYRKYDLPPDSVSWLPNWGWPDRGVFRDFYIRRPTLGAIYFQDKIETEGMIVNAGLRYDFFYPGKEVQTFVDPITLDTVKIGWQNRLVPRIGISHPIAENDKLFFNYGIFYEVPQFSYLYELATQGSSAYKFYGNPGLKPTRNTQYELGVEHAFSNDWLVSVTGFFKDYRELLDLELRGQRPLEGHIFANIDYGNVRGLDFNLEKFYSKYTKGSLAYTLSWAMGKSSSDRQNYDYDYYGRPLPIRDFPLAWDQRHSITVNFDLRIPQGEKPRLLGFRIPDRWGLNLLWQANSGLPYTRTDEKGQPLPEYPENSFRAPGYSSVDLKANKDFDLGPARYSFIFQIKNIFDRENVRAVFGDTGTPWKDREIYKNPLNYFPRRSVQGGLSVEF